VIGQIAGGKSRLDLVTQKFKMENVGEELLSTFVDEDDDLVLEKCVKHNERNQDW